MDRIEILDKVNNLNFIVPKPEYVFHPISNAKADLLELEREYIDLGKEITGVIYKEDGSIMVLYENINRKRD